MLINELPRYEILDEASMQELDRGWRRIVSELGVDFLHDEAIAALKAAGQEVDGQLVKFDVVPGITALADAGQVLTSRTVRDLSSGSGLRFESLGNQRFKGMPEEIEVFRVAAGAD